MAEDVHYFLGNTAGKRDRNGEGEKKALTCNMLSSTSVATSE